MGRKPRLIIGEISTQDVILPHLMLFREIEALWKCLYENLCNFMDALVTQGAFVTTKQLIKSFPEQEVQKKIKCRMPVQLLACGIWRTAGGEDEPAVALETMPLLVRGDHSTDASQSTSTT